MSPARRLVDFDAFRAERKAVPVEIKLGGKVYVLPAAMPADVAFEVIAFRREYGDDAVLPAEKVADMAEALLGKETLDAVVKEHRLTTEELADLVVQVFAEYNKATPPNRATRRRTQSKRSSA